jgi:ATP-dependent Clp protease ATP-binding subunit ClpA
VDILLQDVNLTLAERGFQVRLTGEAKDWLLVQAGIDPSTGARPLRRTIQRHIQDPISEILITQPEEVIEQIEVSVQGEKLNFEPRSRPAEPVGSAEPAGPVGSR